MSLLPYSHRAGMFVRAPLDALVDCLVTRGNEERVRRHAVAKRRQLNLQAAFDLLTRRTFSPDCAILVPLGTCWTAFFNNHRDEFCASSELFIACERLKTDGYFFYHEDRETSSQFGSSQFCAFQFVNEIRRRQVTLYKESNWRFAVAGDPLPFEDLSAYELPRKRDRLNDSMLIRYADALGIPIQDVDSYGRDIAELKWGSPPPIGVESALKVITRIFGRPDLVFHRDRSRGRQN